MAQQLRAFAILSEGWKTFRFTVPKSGPSQLPVPPGPRDPTHSSSLHGHPHTYGNVCANARSHTLAYVYTHK